VGWLARQTSGLRKSAFVGYNGFLSNPHVETRNMEWTTPDFQEVCLSCEINTYANPEY
jgi:coenzyme PQQ precursor peptide PqqA